MGDGQVLRHNAPACCADIEGPNAIAALPDATFVISDYLDRHLVFYTADGKLTKLIWLAKIGIGYIKDMRVRGEKIYLLETSYHSIRVHILTLDGELIESEEVPYQFVYDTQYKENTLAIGLTGLAIDCEQNIVLEVVGGGRLFPLAEAQRQTDPDQIEQGLKCDNQRFFVSTRSPWSIPQVTAGERVYKTHLSEGLGGLRFLEVFQDGSFYLQRDDVMPITPIKVDQSVHFIDANGTVRGAARIPRSEYFYPIERNAVVAPDGEVIVLLPRKNSLDVIRLIFYTELAPLMPEAADPVVILDTK